MIRLFIAVELGEAVNARVACEIARVRRRAPEAKWVRPEAVHITLAFLGWVPDERVGQYRQALERVASKHAPLTLYVRGGGTFGSSKRPRVLWLGIEGDVERLAEVQADLTKELLPLGYEPENRPFKPHLTLARARDKAGDKGLAACAEMLANVDLGESHVGELVLFQSQLSPKGAVYTPLFRPALSGSGLAVVE